MGKPVVLCVDDEKHVLDSLRLQLREAFEDDLDLEIAESGDQALEVIDELIHDGAEIALVISDQIMPGLAGDMLLIHIHRMLPNTLKIMLTGQANADAVGNVVNKAKLYRYIAKPWEDTDLILTVKEAIRSYYQSKTLEEQNKELQTLVLQLKEINESLEEKVKLRTAEIASQRDEIMGQKLELEEKNTQLLDLHQKEKRLLELELKSQKLEVDQGTLQIRVKEEENLRLKAEAETKHSQNEKLHSEIEFQNKELTSFTLFIAQKNELLQQLKKEFQDTLKTMDDKTRVRLKKFVRSLDLHIEKDKDWQRVKMHFERVHKGFFDKLILKHPGLTSNDLRFCAYLQMNLTTKEIANLLGSSVRTVESSRYRLRKKLELSGDDDLVVYMHQIGADQ